jgi:hypothetical protein
MNLNFKFKWWQHLKESNVVIIKGKQPDILVCNLISLGGLGRRISSTRSAWATQCTFLSVMSSGTFCDDGNALELGSSIL